MSAALPVLGSGLFGVAGSVASKALAPKAAAAAAPTPAPVMPIADDAKTQAARKRAIATMQQRQGRASTILTNNSDTLGA